MKFKGLLTAVIVLTALGGGVYWSDKAKKAEEKEPAKDAPPKVLTIPEDQFKGIQFKKAGGETTVVQKSDAGQWDIVAPKPMMADSESVGSVVTTLATLTSDRLIEDKASELGSYGLTSPALEVVVTKKDGKTEDLLVGDDTPTGGSVFVKLKNDPRVFSVASGVKSSLDKTTKDLRDKRLLTFDSDKLTRVELQAKGPAIEFGKNNQNEWQIVKPKPLRADGSQVDELVGRLKNAKIDASVSDEEAKKAPAAFASAARIAVVKVADSAGTQTIEVRQDKDKNYYAKSSVLDGVYKAAPDVGVGLDRNLDAFRSKKLFDFGFNDPTKLTINKTSYDKSGEKWMLGAKQMDSTSVQAVIDKLRDLASTKFLDGESGAMALEIAVTSNDGKRNEKVIMLKQAANYIARRENEPSAYQLDPKAVEELQKSVSEIREFQPPKTDSKKK
jgi:hypothetical protein